MARTGNLIIVSGPSGAGKSAISAATLACMSGLGFSISYTTRAPRGSERDGVEYHFVDRPAFEELIAGNHLLEWAEVYGNLYGTSRHGVDEILSRGDDVLLDVDVQGALSIREKRPEAITVFILPPSFQVLRDRLNSRKQDKHYVIQQRLKIACREIKSYSSYDYLIVNNDLARSIEEMKAIILGARCRISVRSAEATRIVATFGGLDAEDS